MVSACATDFSWCFLFTSVITCHASQGCPDCHWHSGTCFEWQYTGNQHWPFNTGSLLPEVVFWRCCLKRCFITDGLSFVKSLVADSAFAESMLWDACLLFSWRQVFVTEFIYIMFWSLKTACDHKLFYFIAIKHGECHLIWCEKCLIYFDCLIFQTVSILLLQVIEFEPPRAVDAVSDLFTKACFSDEGEDSNRYL